MSLLSVGLDAVAVMRSARRHGEPDPSQMAVLAELAGVDGVAVQLQRIHKRIKPRDLYLLKGIVKSKLTIEMSPAEENLALASEIKPWMVTFAADHTDSDSPMVPIDFNNAAVDFSESTSRLGNLGINTCFFIDPEPDSIKGASRMGAWAVLINCLGYTEALTIEEAQSELDRIDRAVNIASKSDLTVCCGCGLNYKNVKPLVELGLVDEFFIGHSVCARAFMVGWERAVSEMLAVVQTSSVAG